MHIIINKNMSVQDSHLLSHKIETIIQKIYGICDVHIHLEPCEHNDCPICMTPCDEKSKE